MHINLRKNKLNHIEKNNKNTAKNKSLKSEVLSKIKKILISMRDSKLSQLKEKQRETKTKCKDLRKKDLKSRKNLFRNPLKIRNKPTVEIINNQIDIKLSQLTEV